MMSTLKCLDLLSTPRFHIIATIVWLLLGIPTVIWWRNSILWLAIMSLYAIIIGHWSAYQAARTEEKVDQKD